MEFPTAQAAAPRSARSCCRALEGARRRQSGRIFRAARLGPAHRRSCSPRRAPSRSFSLRSASYRHAVPLRQVRCEFRRDGRPRARGVRHRACVELMLIKIFAPGFYAKQDIRTPVKIAIGVLIMTQVSNYIFVPIFSHAGLTLSIGLGALANAMLLFIGLESAASTNRRRDGRAFSCSWSARVSCLRA